MSQPNEVILYRNPLEYALWNSFDIHYFFIVIVAGIVGIIAAVVADNIIDRFFRGNRLVKKHQGNIILGALVGGAFLTGWYMWI